MVGRLKAKSHPIMQGATFEVCINLKPKHEVLLICLWLCGGVNYTNGIQYSFAQGYRHCFDSPSHTE